MGSKFLTIDQRISKREKVIPRYIQEEVLKILNTNAIPYGFYVSTWSERRVRTLLKERYNIEITGYMARLLLEDSKYYDEYRGSKLNDIKKLNKLGYAMFSLHFIKVGKMQKDEIEAILSKNFYKEIVNVYLGIAISEKRIYVKLIVSSENINYKKQSVFQKKSKGISSEEKYVVHSKVNFIREVMNKENTSKDIIFVCKDADYIERFNKRNKNKSKGKILFYVVTNEDIDILLKHYKKNKEIMWMNNLKSKNREFKSIYDVKMTIDNKFKELNIEDMDKIYIL